jgi:hypothetical protein
MAYDDFAHRCEHMQGIFNLQGQFSKPLMEYSPTQWLRTATWWYIKGRVSIEKIVRQGKPPSPDGQRAQELLLQPHVDLAKAMWILTEVIPVHPALPESQDPSFPNRAAAAAAAKDQLNAEFYESCEFLLTHLKYLTSSMSKNNAMPPYNALIQGQDQSIWIYYPQLAAEIVPILSGREFNDINSGVVFNPMTVMAVADTQNDFVYERWFIQATLYSEREQKFLVPLVAMFSLMRTRNEWHPKVSICTQTELMTLCIAGDRRLGPSWEDVKWSAPDSSIQIRLPQGFILNAQLGPQEYTTLSTMYKKAWHVQESLFPIKNLEQAIYEVALEDFLYTDSVRPPAFPYERTKRSRVRVFLRTEVVDDDSEPRKFYRGVRILVATSPKNRVLADVSHELGGHQPIILELLNEDMPGGQTLPAMRLHVKEDRRQASLYMVFAQLMDRHLLYSALTEDQIGDGEMEFASVRLKKLSIEPTTDVMDYPKAGLNPLGRMQWVEVVVINKAPGNAENEVGETVHSEHLRIVAQGAGGTIVDRINQGTYTFAFRP